MRRSSTTHTCRCTSQFTGNQCEGSFLMTHRCIPVPGCSPPWFQLCRHLGEIKTPSCIPFPPLSRQSLRPRTLSACYKRCSCSGAVRSRRCGTHRLRRRSGPVEPELPRSLPSEHEVQVDREGSERRPGRPHHIPAHGPGRGRVQVLRRAQSQKRCGTKTSCVFAQFWSKMFSYVLRLCPGSDCSFRC